MGEVICASQEKRCFRTRSYGILLYLYSFQEPVINFLKSVFFKEDSLRNSACLVGYQCPDGIPGHTAGLPSACRRLDKIPPAITSGLQDDKLDKAFS